MSTHAHPGARGVAPERERSGARPTDARAALLRNPAALARSPLALYAVLFAGAALISGFTIFRGGAPFDEGVVLQAARRVADGQLPYRDFLWAYGPAQPYLLGAWFDTLGTSLMSWRVMRVGLDAGVALLVYVVARREGSSRLALAAWLAAACAMAQPTSATPLPAALLLSLAAFALATRRSAKPRDPLVAGLLCALAAAWRIDFALYGAGAVLVALALRPAERTQRLRDVAVFAAAATVGTLVAYLPFAAAIGPADLYDALVGNSLTEREWWTLPFPLSYDGDLRAWPPSDLATDLKDLLGFYLPALLVAGLVLVAGAAALRLRSRELPWRLAGLLVLAFGSLLYLLSRADEFHAGPLLVALVAAVPAVIATSRRALAVAAGVLLALTLAYGVLNRGSALRLAPELAAIDVPVAHGAKAPPAEARALERMVRLVQSRVPAGEPIYTITRRSDLVRFNQPLVYVLAERENPTRADFALQTSPPRQRRLVAELRREQPRAIVRWTDPISTVREPNLRGRPSGSRELDRYVAREYRLLERAGRYEVLIPR